MVYKNSPNKQAAWEFMRFISNPKDDLDQHQAQGILPVWTVNLETAYVKARPDYHSTQEMLKQPVPPEYYHPKSNELATAFGEAVVAALYGKGQPKPLLDEAAAKMDRILAD
jgi:ABC-type glycerol-3-phosphate transport system substrate-binding protein